MDALRGQDRFEGVLGIELIDLELYARLLREADLPPHDKALDADEDIRGRIRSRKTRRARYQA